MINMTRFFMTNGTNVRNVQSITSCVVLATDNYVQIIKYHY